MKLFILRIFYMLSMEFHVKLILGRISTKQYTSKQSKYYLKMNGTREKVAIKVESIFFAQVVILAEHFIRN